MKLVTQTEHLSSRFGDELAIKIICKSGFDGIDYSMFSMEKDDCILNTPAYEKYALKLLDISESFGKTFEQAHAPFPTCKDGDEKYNKTMMERVKRSIEIAGILNAKIIVVHPVAYKKNQFEKNIEMYKELEKTAEKSGVKIALENMWGWNGKRIVPNVCSIAEDFNKHFDALDTKNFTCCLDLGHCGLVGEDAAYMIREMGHDRIGALHIHDNNNINDSHTLPYTMNMDWDSILMALGQINYPGNFTYEADNFLARFPGDLMPACEKFMHDVGRSMMKKIEFYRLK